jgi:hypothetical protein
MKILSFLFIAFTCFSLMANNANEALKKLDIKPRFYYQTPFNEECFERISGAKVVEAGLVYESTMKDFEVFSSNRLFLLNGNNVSMFSTAYELLTSSEFVGSIRADFKINTKDDAAIFQDLLVLVDKRSSWTSFFKQENDWIFVRSKWFDDFEVWKVSTNSKGGITAIEFNSRMALIIPEEVFEIDYPSVEYNQLDGYVLSDEHTQKIQKIIDEKIRYVESSEELSSETLKAVSDAAFYRFSFSLEEEITDEDGTYTSSSNQVFDAIDFNGNMLFFYNFTEILESPMFIESLKPSFVLKEKTDASVFEAMLDDFTDYMSSEKMVFFENDVWNFVRDESFDDKVGFAVIVDTEGKIKSIKYSNPLGIEVAEEAFDETTADWGFNLLLPESTSIEVVEGTPINYAVEFNDEPVTKMGAWIFATLNNENLNMYFGNEIYSPHYDDIRGEELPIGRHMLDIYLMRPGNDTETALDKASVEINVVPFNDEGIVWDFVMTEPKSNTVKANAGESVPVAFTFNADEANRLGVRFEIYFNGELVGGRTAPNLESPIKTDIPGSEMKPGTNKVEFVFAGGTKTLAKFEVNVEVK